MVIYSNKIEYSLFTLLKLFFMNEKKSSKTVESFSGFNPLMPDSNKKVSHACLNKPVAFSCRFL